MGLIIALLVGQIVINAPVGMSYQYNNQAALSSTDGRAANRTRHAPGPIVIGNHNQVRVYHIVQLGAINRAYPSERIRFRLLRRQ